MMNVRQPLVFSVGVLVCLALFAMGWEVLQSADPPVPGMPAKARGRLPTHFKDVVTETQRQKIYAIQAKYDAEIDGLAARIKRLQAEQMREMEGVLEPDQVAKLKRLRAAAEAKKKKGIDPIEPIEIKEEAKE